MYQTGKNVRVAFAPEVTFNTIPGVAPAATQLRILPGPGLRLARAGIESREVRADGQSSMGRLGSRSVNGSYPVELAVGAFDALLAAALRGTWSGTDLVPAVPPVNRSFIVEEYEQDIDAVELFSGVRVSSLSVSLTPDGIAQATFGFVGADMDLREGAAAPYFTAVTENTAEALVAVEAVITLGGTPVVDFTACEFTLELGGATQPVIGSLVTPDVFLNNMRITGSVSALRKDILRQQSYLAEDELELVLALAEPAPGTGTLTFTLPQIKFTDFSADLGNDNAVVATMPFMAGRPAGGSMIEIASTL